MFSDNIAGTLQPNILENVLENVLENIPKTFRDNALKCAVTTLLEHYTLMFLKTFSKTFSAVHFL